MSTEKGLPDIRRDFSRWYHEVIVRAQLVDQSPTRGCVVLRPYGYAIWERIRDLLDARIKNKGAENAYFPLLIPEAFLKKEADHIEGFAPELAVVTHAGGKELAEPYVIRPTSETIVYHMFARWITSWRDLPLKINQWANIVRWELRTRPFLRTTEILWQEGHTAHLTKEDAHSYAQEMLAEYVSLMEGDLALPLFTGRKTAKERFAGAEETYCMEALMPNGRALQMGTSHLLAHSFPAAYGVQFQDKNGDMAIPWCTSWGVTTRMIGAVVMAHGDQRGLVLPPRIAPQQVVIIPIFRKEEERAAVFEQAYKVKAELEACHVRVFIDETEERPGAKFFKWEEFGVPIRLEMGPRDVEKKSTMVVPRIELEGAERKKAVLCKALSKVIPALLTDIQNALYTRACTYTDALTSTEEDDVSRFGKKLSSEGGAYRVSWCGGSVCEEVLEKYKAGIRCVFTKTIKPSLCFACRKPAYQEVLVAKGY